MKDYEHDTDSKGRKCPITGKRFKTTWSSDSRPGNYVVCEHCTDKNSPTIGSSLRALNEKFKREYEGNEQ